MPPTHLIFLVLNLCTTFGFGFIDEDVYEIRGSVVFSEDIVEHCRNATYDIGSIVEEFNSTAESILVDNPLAEWMQYQSSGLVFKLGMSGLRYKVPIPPREAMEDMKIRLQRRVDTICGRAHPHETPVVDSDELFPYSRMPRVKELYALGWLLNSLLAPFVMKVESVFITPSEWAGLHIPVDSERISISASMLNCEYDKIHASVCVNYVPLKQIYPLYFLNSVRKGSNVSRYAVRMDDKLFLIKDECEEHDTGVIDGDHDYDEEPDYDAEPPVSVETFVPHECTKKPTHGYDFPIDGCRFSGFRPKESLTSSPKSRSECHFDDFAASRKVLIREELKWPSDLLSRRRTSAFADDPSSLVGMAMDSFMKDFSSPNSATEKIAEPSPAIQSNRQKSSSPPSFKAPHTGGNTQYRAMWAFGILLLVISICGNVMLLDAQYGQSLHCDEGPQPANAILPATVDARPLIV